jgi:hypothetical protein
MDAKRIPFEQLPITNRFMFAMVFGHKEIDIAVYRERQRANEIQKQADAERARADEEKARADRYEKMLRELGML